jgi:hypothetical protein
VRRPSATAVGLLIVVAWAVLSAIGCGGGSGSSASPGTREGHLDPADALALAKDFLGISDEDTYNNGDPAHVTGHAEPFQLNGDRYVSTTTTATVSRDPAAGFSFKMPTNSPALAVPAAIARDASNPIRVSSGDALFFANAYPSTDVLVSQFGGLDEGLMLRGPGAPETFRWQITTPGNHWTLKPNADAAGLYGRWGHNGTGYPLLVGAFPYPHDSTKPTREAPGGKKVATKVEVSGDQLTLTVDHRSADLVYPVVVDLNWESGGFPRNGP